MIQKDSSSKAIVLFSLSYFPTIGGAERQLQTLCERWARQGQAVWVLTRAIPGQPLRETIHGVHVVRLRVWWFPGLSWISFAIGALSYLYARRDLVDSLWCMMFNLTAGAAVFCGKVLKRPVVVRFSASGSGGNIRVMQRTIGGRRRILSLLNRCRALIILNQEMMKELEPYHVPPERIHLIPNGVDTDVFKPADATRRKVGRAALGVGEDETLSLFVGRLEHQKNLFNVLNAWAGLQKRHRQAQLFLVGEGSQEKTLRGQIDRLGLAGRVRLMKNQTDILSLYQSADLFVLPSYFEGLSNALLEAMATGLPVLASRVAGNLDVLREPGMGTLVDPGRPETWVEPWSELLSHADTRIRLGAKARQWVKDHYSIQKTLEAYQALHESFSL